MSEWQQLIEQGQGLNDDLLRWRFDWTEDDENS